MSTAIVMPKLGLTMTEGTIDQWYKEEGDLVKKGEAVCSISSEKLTQDVEAAADGILLKKTVEQGDEVPVQQTIAVIGKQGESVEKEQLSAISGSEERDGNNSPGEKAAAAATLSKKPGKKANGKVIASPVAKRLAKEKGINISDVEGTGPNGRITKQDIERFEEDRILIETDVTPEMTEPETAGTPSGSTIGEGLSPMRKTIAKRMHSSLGQTAQLTLQRRAKLNDLLELRKRIKGNESERHAQKLSLTVFIAKAAIKALQEHPEMNSWYQNGQLIEHQEIHLGIATTISGGLLVPVIKHTQDMPLGTLGSAMEGAAKKARNGELSGDQLTGSTFTVTNLGQSGVEYFTPILNTPETGILGVGSFQESFTVDREGNIAKTKELPLSLTFDHQIIDGAPAADFLATIVYYIEHPYLLVL